MRKKRPLKFKYFLILELLLAVGLTYFFVARGSQVKQAEPLASVVEVAPTSTFPIAEKKAVETPREPFTRLEAKGVAVYDLSEDKMIFSSHKDDVLPIASITKLMTVYTASKYLTSDSIITIDQTDIDLDSGSSLVVGEHWNLKNLIAFTLITSSNAGANAIAKEAEKQSQINFVVQMNETAKSIGLQNTIFRNPTGLDIYEYRISGANSTARDIAYLYSYIYQNSPELLDNTNRQSTSIYSADNIPHYVYSTNEIINEIPELISAKTGTTPLAGGNFAILFNPIKDHPVAIVVLGGTSEGRFFDMKKLIKDTEGALGN